MGDNSVYDQQESLEEQLSGNSESDEEEVIIEEYETYYIPSSLVLLDKEGHNLQNEDVLDTGPNECQKNQVENSSNRKPGQSNIKTITRIDEDTENVVILIRPRRRSVSPSEQKFISKNISIDSMEKEENNILPQTCETLGKKETINIQKQTCDQTLGKQDVSSCGGDEEYGKNNSENQLSPKMYKENIPYESEKSECVGGSPNKSSLSTEYENDTENKEKNSISNSNNSIEQLFPSKSHENEDQRDTCNQISETEIRTKYENQGARPKTKSPAHERSDTTIEHVVLKNSDKDLKSLGQPENIKKCSGHYGISQEASEKVKKLKEMGKYDDLVRTCNIQRNKGVVHDLVQKMNMGNQDTTEEDDVLIWKVMQSLKDKSTPSGNVNKRDNSDEDIHSSDSLPKDKCDWSYEKATMSKDKYLSRRLQTKEKGQVKIITFVSPSKDKEVNIKPLQVSKTLPFNVKHIFQQKMNEVKNKDIICLTGGKELMFTKFNVDDPMFQCSGTLTK